jgi:nondiscriminating aspartyl-tRNA synthetase
MTRTLIKDLQKQKGKEVTVEGWITVRRDQGKMVFYDFRDRTGSVQGVLLPGAEIDEEVKKESKPQCIVRVSAKVNPRPEKNVKADVQNGDIELEVTNMEFIARPVDLPFEVDAEVNIDTYLDYQPYTVRSEKSRHTFKVQETIIESFREALREEDFTEFQAPALVGGDAEGGAAAFQVDYYYQKKAFLATSPQFYKQIMVGAYERAFATPKVFRGEKHATTRHLSEYSSMDFEMGFIKDHTDVMAVLEKAVRHICAKVAEKHPGAFSAFKADLPLIPEKFPVLKLREVQKILNAPEEPDLEPEHERAICEWAKKEHGSDFVFVTHYPVSKRPFYTYEDEEDPGFTKSFDLLFRGLEITTGGEREHRYEELIKKMEAKNLDPSTFSFYLQAFKYGMPPHGGSATGLERFTARMLNIPNVKEATLFPRDLNRIDSLLSE